MYNDELTHYGVKGMRWGVRKNNIGFNKKRISKKYAKESTKMMKDLTKTYSSRYVKAYNDTVNSLNKQRIYDEDLFNDLLDKKYNELTYNEMKNNKHYKKTVELCKKYDMIKFDDLAKQNQETINEIRKSFQK